PRRVYRRADGPRGGSRSISFSAQALLRRNAVLRSVGRVLVPFFAGAGLPWRSRSSIVATGRGAAGGAPALPSPRRGHCAGVCLANGLVRRRGPQIVVPMRRRASGSLERTWAGFLSGVGTAVSRLVPGGIGAN